MIFGVLSLAIPLVALVAQFARPDFLRDELADRDLLNLDHYITNLKERLPYVAGILLFGYTVNTIGYFFGTELICTGETGVAVFTDIFGEEHEYLDTAGAMCAETLPSWSVAIGVITLFSKF